MPEEQTRLDRFSAFMTRHKLLVLLVVLVATVAVGLGVTRMNTEVILRDMFPYNHPYLKLQARFSQVFGSGGSGVVIAVKVKDGDIFTPKTLRKVKKINDEIELLDEVLSRWLTTSIAHKSTKVVKTLTQGEIFVQPLMFPQIPETDEEMAELKKHIFSDPAKDGILVSSDGSAVLILTEFKENISYERVFTVLRGVVEKYSDEETSIHIVGFPMLMGWIYSLKAQMRVVFGVSVGLILLILILIFRNFQGMIVPILVGLISTAIGLGFIGWTGLNFSPLLFVLGFLVGARKISHSVQITHRYMEEFQESGNDKDKACYETMRTMIMPNVAGVTTDAAGFLVLLLAKIVLLQQLAIIMSFWMLSIAFSAILTPILCYYIPLKGASERWSKTRSKMDLLDRISTAVSGFCIGSGRYVVAVGTIVIVIFCGWEATRLKIGDSTPGSPLLWPDHTYNKDQALINEKFKASSENLMLYYEGRPGSVYDPMVLMTFEDFAEHMRESLPDIYKSSNSLTNMLSMMNVMLRDGHWVRFQLPTSQVELTAILGYCRKSVDTPFLRRFVDYELERSQITLFFADHTSENLLRIRDAAYDFFKDRPMKTEQGEFKLAGGRIGMEIAVNEEMKRSHLLIDAMVLATIFVMCTICFRSIVAGLMLTIPLILSNLVAFAYMSIMDIGLSINTLPVAAVGVGVGVDFAIYLYSRCVEEYPHHESWAGTVLASVRTCGKAIVYTGLTLILAILPWYYISELKFQAQMGFFLSMLLLANVILSLTLHPLLICIIKPRFIAKRKASGHEGVMWERKEVILEDQ
jgi:uncharacterized protein